MEYKFRSYAEEQETGARIYLAEQNLMDVYRPYISKLEKRVEELEKELSTVRKSNV